MKQDILLRIDEIAIKIKELQKSIIGLKALKCQKCKKVVWTCEVCSDEK